MDLSYFLSTENTDYIPQTFHCTSCMSMWQIKTFASLRWRWRWRWSFTRHPRLGCCREGQGSVQRPGHPRAAVYLLSAQPRSAGHGHWKITPFLHKLYRSRCRSRAGWLAGWQTGWGAALGECLISCRSRGQSASFVLSRWSLSPLRGESFESGPTSSCRSFRADIYLINRWKTTTRPLFGQ